MFDSHFSLSLEVKGKAFTGFCMRISDEFHETYAVILDGYESFSVWLDKSTEQWKASRYANVDDEILNGIYKVLPPCMRVFS